MTTVGHPVRVLAVASACGLLLSACSAGDDSGSEPAGTVTETVTESATVSSEPTETTSSDNPDGGDDGAAGGSGGVKGLPPKPGRDECVEITTPRNGRYRVYDAGTAVVRRDGGRLRVGRVDAARGWRGRVTDRGGDDVEIGFRPRQRGAQLELEVEIDDGRVEAKICVDDRDVRDDDRDDRDDD